MLVTASCFCRFTGVLADQLTAVVYLYVLAWVHLIKPESRKVKKWGSEKIWGVKKDTSYQKELGKHYTRVHGVIS